jgi:outer membrane receptor protein involved in Fe transport
VGKPLAYPKSNLQLAVLSYFAAAAMTNFAWGADTSGKPPSNPATAQELPQITVISNTPLEGLGLPLNQIPANVQTADSKDMESQQTLGIADYLNNNFSGVSVSDSADNPFQLDINYHGFTASPLLGTPEGLSIYLDGVRVNESFGDTVNWDLIPQNAVSTITLLSGSNPVFGLNTLGGALSLRTKSGHDNPGTELEAYGGSFGRRSFEGETGGEFGNFDYFFAGTYFDENGWRENSPSRVYQAFGKAGWQNEKTDFDLSYTYADTSLYGNGAAPMSMLDYDRESSYTPDYTANLMSFVNLTGTQFLTDKLLLSGNVFYRHLVTNAVNGNTNDSYLAGDYAGPPLDCTAPGTSLASLTYCTPGQNASSRLVQNTKGVALQLTDSEDLFGWSNQSTLGADLTDTDDSFSQGYQYGALTPGRVLIDTVSPYNNETVISLSGRNKIHGTYFTDTLSPGKLLHFTLSVRYNQSTETLSGYSIDSDITDFGNGFNAPTTLSGDHTFSRVNPAFGFTVTPDDTLTLYADYNQASRAPTVIELGCANPQAPCGLPNDFASDPDLKQVVARTFEVGARGNLDGEQLNWSADFFRTVNRDDIQFVATAANAGYFDNVGNTLRQGLDFSLGNKEGRLKWHLAYSYVEATFQSAFKVSAQSNSTADANGDILVQPGDRIPLIPKHTGRLNVDYAITPQWDVGANVIATSGSYLHGNENNANQAGGTNGEGGYVVGSGWIPGYAVVSLRSTYRVSKRLELFARLGNLFDKRYATAGFLTSNSFNPNGSLIANPDDWTNENAVSPGAPRAVWGGIRVRLE